MTLTWVPIPLTFDGNDLQTSDLTIHLQITEGLNEVAQVRGRDVVVPAADGQVFRNRRADTRRIVLSGHVMGTGTDEADRRSSFRATMKLLASIFDPTASPADLVATLEDGTTGTIAARTLNILVAERIPSEYAAVSVELLSVEPDWTFTVTGS